MTHVDIEKVIFALFPCFLSGKLIKRDQEKKFPGQKRSEISAAFQDSRPAFYNPFRLKTRLNFGIVLE